MIIENLLRLARLYAAHQGLSLSTVSTYAANDGKFFPTLSVGAGCTVARADRVLQYFSDNWPADLEWPRDVPRPPKGGKEAA